MGVRHLLKTFIFLGLLISNGLCGASHNKVAICYFGLTRSTKKVYQSHFKHLFNVLDKSNIKYDVFMHTWDVGPTQQVWGNMINVPVDYEEYLLLNPSYYCIDNQNEFLDTLDFSQYFYQEVYDKYGDNPRGEWRPELIRNHLCALESQKRVTDMVYSSGKEYDLIMYIRPDVELTKQFPLKNVLSIGDHDIVLPNFDHYEGYNDRFAVLTYKSAPIYGKRIDHIIEFRKTQGRIVSEKYVKYTCKNNHLNVVFINFIFKIVRP